MKKEEVSEPYELNLLKKNINLKKLIDLLDNESDDILYSSRISILFNIYKSSTKKNASIRYKRTKEKWDCYYDLFYPELSWEEDWKKKISLMINGSLLPTVCDNFILIENFKKFYPNKKNKEISLIFQNIYSKINKSYYLTVYEEMREFTTYSDGPYPEYYNDYYILGKFKNTKSLLIKVKKIKEEKKKIYSNFIFRS
jgi:hypothetical protein